MSGVILVWGEENHQASFTCRWHASGSTITDASASTSWQAIDIFFKETSRSPGFSWPKDLKVTRLSIDLSAKGSCEIGAQDFESTAAFGFVLDCLAASNHEHESVARLVVPQTSGYIIRSDIIPQRLLGCPLVTSVVGFPKPHHHFDGEPVGRENLLQLPRILAASAGGMLLKHVDATKMDTQGSLLASLDLELRNRLSFPWLSTQEPKRRTLAIVDGGISGPDNGGTGGSIYMAAEALGIDMVVFDSPNHWVNSPRYSHWRKASVPLDCKLEPDADFPNQIAEAVRSYNGQIDGILTFRDHYKFPVAEAALQLSLPTYAPSAYEIATNKFKTSVSEGHHAFRASSAEEASTVVREHKLEFPLIIKPTNGFLSEGVFRVENLAQLEASTQGINKERHGNEFVIEKYCEGPEVDANFVLCDGELLFFEASDDFPKTGDVNGHGAVKSFIELANVLPSKLPASELAILRDSLHKSLLRMGFRDGFYHLEARIENSRMEYVARNGVLDLAERPIPAKGVPYTWLIEVNPRPPGIQASEAVRHTYGLDYFGLALLFALDDKERVRQLSHPFAQGHQYWCEMVFIPVEKGGVYDSGDVCAELFARRTDLAANVSGSFCFLRKGDVVQDPAVGVNSWVAYFNVFSRESREHLLGLGDEIRREVRFSIV
ncbi:ATP-grasp domain-containing protein [Trichoderma barbatum]